MQNKYPYILKNKSHDILMSCRIRSECRNEIFGRGGSSRTVIQDMDNIIFLPIREYVELRLHNFDIYKEKEII